MNKLPEHLGGHCGITHTDAGCLEFVSKSLGVKSMLDIGCGPGGMVDYARSVNIEGYGVDGDFTIDRGNISKHITIHDYEQGTSDIETPVDLIWSVEFLEHVDEKCQENYMKDFQLGKYAIITYAPIGWGGHHHVNCNTEEYWIDVFSKYGFNLDEEYTKHIREKSTMKRDFIRDRGLFFRSTKELS